MNKIINFLVVIGIVFIAFTSCIKRAAREAAEEVVEQGIKDAAEDVIEQGTKEVVETIVEDGIKKGAGVTLKAAMASNKLCKIYYHTFQKNISKDFADGIVVNSTKNGIEMVSKEFPTSAIRIQGNTIFCKAGSLIDNGQVNQFLNYLLPNKTYLIDDGAFVYKTDHLGRVINASSDRTKGYLTLGGKRNPQRNSDVQDMIVEKLGGKRGYDDGGHLFANATGGPNELINQVPMEKSLNRNGEWRRCEMIEEQALKEGKNVTSQRNLLYKGDDMRPYAIEFITTIDGEETRVVIQNTIN